MDAAATEIASISDTPALDAELLLAEVMERPRSHFRAWPDRKIPPSEVERFEALVARRCLGEPIAYLLGHREFWSLTLAVTPETLIPRPDTEQLVEAALEKIPGSERCRIVDLGCGSGAIALALASERPFAEVTAIDASPGALRVATDNARINSIDNVVFLESDWWSGLGQQRFDIVVSNPPYIRVDDPHLERGDLRFEPREALVAGDDGLDAYRDILTGLDQHLEPGGWLLLEHGHDQADALAELLANQGLEDIRCIQDLGSNDRVTLARRPLQ
ncbi:MAG: peptide chain release factor N(5)-glutamine methyltransferase [Gammaproteobacteria bacterium]|nr:peptide chain release factor N(5)-glutamine methyltransferase [Gammaproteobacteria bacterium]